VRRAFETQALVHAVDLFATIAELSGGAVPPGSARDSRSFVACLRAPEARVRSWVFADWDPPIAPGVAKPPKRERALVTERHKLRRVGKAGALVEELYDLARDPLELHPLDPDAPEHAHVASEMRAILDRLE